MKVTVYHGYYGCDTGCCGHVLDIDDDRFNFDFHHEKGLSIESIKEWVSEHIPPECLDTIDWDSVEVVRKQDCR